MASGRPKLEDVARVAGVSRAAASRALNGQPGTSEVVSERVRTVASQLGFRPHSAARALATGGPGGSRADVIEILIIDPDPDALSAKPFYSRVLTGANRALSGDLRLQVRLAATAPTVDHDPPFGRVLINMPVQVVLRSPGTRTVALGQAAPGVPYVVPDNVGGARQAATHLVATGRRRIGAVFGPATPCAGERQTGFLRAMADAGIAVAALDGDFTRPTGYAATRHLLAAHPDLDAIFAACDVTAMGVLDALRSTGRRVPEVAVVGFDGSALAEAANLTSVYIPVEEEAELAVRTLLDPSTPTGGRLPAALAVRGSS